MINLQSSAENFLHFYNLTTLQPDNPSDLFGAAHTRNNQWPMPTLLMTTTVYLLNTDRCLLTLDHFQLSPWKK